MWTREHIVHVWFIGYVIKGICIHIYIFLLQSNVPKLTRQGSSVDPRPSPFFQGGLGHFERKGGGGWK